MTVRNLPVAACAALRRLIADRAGVLMIEFAMALPILLLFGLAGAELTNYIITRMRISQLALHIADNAARIGEGSQLSQKVISELDIDDVLTGAGLQAGELALFERGRVIISSVENDPANSGRYRIRWQRCRGAKQYDSPYDNHKTNLTGVGPAGRQVTTVPDGATMWVDVAYDYRPLVAASYAPSIEMIETASMLVRDRRALNAGNNGVLQVNGVTPSTC